MASNILGKGKIVLEYFKKYKGLSKKALGKKLHQDYPLIFKNPEAARALICYYSGAMGESALKKLKKENKIDFVVPKSKIKQPKNHILDACYNNILWLSDIHAPNHDEQALQLAIEYGLANKINCIVLGGDIIDNFPFTKHEKKPDRGEAKEMFDCAIDILTLLRMTFPDAKIIWLEGNHDKWYQKWLATNAPMVWDDTYYSLQERLGLDDLDIMYLPEKCILKIDGLNALHGHTLMRGFLAPVNPARGVFLKAKANTIIGHCHQSSKHTESNLKNQIISCFSTGALCDMHPDYDPHNTKHNLGFAHITRNKGNFHVRNLEIYNNQIL